MARKSKPKSKTPKAPTIRKRPFKGFEWTINGEGPFHFEGKKPAQARLEDGSYLCTGEIKLHGNKTYHAFIRMNAERQILGAMIVTPKGCVRDISDPWWKGDPRAVGIGVREVKGPWQWRLSMQRKWRDVNEPTQRPHKDVPVIKPPVPKVLKMRPKDAEEEEAPKRRRRGRRAS